MNARRRPLVLVADDDPAFVRVVRDLLTSCGYRVAGAADKAALLGTLANELPVAVLLEVHFGEHDGIEVLGQLLVAHPGLRIVMLTARGSIDSATAAIKLGAVDYLTKPIDHGRLRAVVRDAAEGVRDGARSSGDRAGGRAPVPSQLIVGESAAMERLRDMIAKAAVSQATVLILGESGTGKELVARALHEQSPRRNGPFIAINVAALPRELVESTLFGHAKGAFTGAGETQIGCCEAADGGTLFLDEIGEMEPSLQAKLLRFLQEKSFQRVGQSTTIVVDARIVAATNRALEERVAVGHFRDDLYYRLNVVSIEVPPLRERRSDIPVLARHFLDGAAARCGRGGLSFSPEALDALAAREWPGNVRELENFVERLTVLNPDLTVFGPEVATQLPSSTAVTAPAETAGEEASSRGAGQPELTEISRVEKEAIIRALVASGGNVREAAKALGLSQATVYRRIKRYGIAGESGQRRFLSRASHP